MVQLELHLPAHERQLPPDAAGPTDLTCRVCGLTKNAYEFPYRSLARGKRQKICKHCRSEYHKAWYGRSRPMVLHRSRRNRRKAKQRARVTRERMWGYLAGHPCVDCGTTDTRILDFDHLRDKRAEVGALVRGGASWDVVFKEIQKCEVRCANCHRRRTAYQVGSYRTRPMDLQPLGEGAEWAEWSGVSATRVGLEPTNLLIRSQTLYPAELPGQIIILEAR